MIYDLVAMTISTTFFSGISGDDDRILNGVLLRERSRPLIKSRRRSIWTQLVPINACGLSFTKAAGKFYSGVRYGLHCRWQLALTVSRNSRNAPRGTVSKNVWSSSPCSESKAERALFDMESSVVRKGEEQGKLGG